MIRTIRGEEYNITRRGDGWSVVKMAAKIDRIGRSYHVQVAGNGMPVKCSCGDQFHRGGVCKHMTAVIEVIMGPDRPDQ